MLNGCHGRRYRLVKRPSGFRKWKEKLGKRIIESNINKSTRSEHHRVRFPDLFNGGLLYFSLLRINVRECRRDNQKWTIQRNWQHRQRKTQHNMHWHHYAQINTNTVNKTWTLLQTTGGKDEPSIVFKLKPNEHHNTELRT
jgi:hypothetical protein